MVKNTSSKINSPHPLRVLLVEDSEDDALLELRELKKGGYAPEYERVETAAAMRKALQDKTWDVILCDYQMPGFNGIEAIALLQRMKIDIPIIIVSGVIGEDTAVECMRFGAHDYIMKSHLARLASAVARELEDRKAREKIKQAELKLQESEQKFKALFESMSNCMAIYEAVDDGSDFVFKEFNRAAEKTEHISRSDLIGKSVLEVFPGVREMGLLDALKRVWTSGMPERLEASFYQDGRVQGWKENYVYKLSGGEIVAIYDDITERKKIQEALQESEEKYRLVAETAHDFIVITDLNYKIIFTNKAVSNFAGGIHLVGRSIIDFIPPGLLSKHGGLMEKRRAGIDEVFSFEWELSNDTGNTIIMDVRSQLLKEEGKPAAVLFIARDITERKLAQQEMMRKSEEIADLYNNAPCGYHSLSADGTILRINDTELRWLRYNRDDVIGKKKWADFLTPNGQLIFKRTFPILKNQKWISDIEYELVRKDGSSFPVLLNATVVIDENGNYLESRSTCFDLTERKQAEEERHRLRSELFQSQKMEAIGTLAGGIAHDLNNILGGILGYTELVLTSHITQDHPARRYMDGVMRGIDRACDLVSHIKTFSRQGEKERKLIGIGPIIKEALKLMKATLPATIEMRQHIIDAERTIFADPTQMHQVVMNLCTNAAHSMKEKGGILDVSLSQITFGVDDDTPHPDIKTGIEYELLIVRDTGYGIDPENIVRIFDPFFTTKKPGEGTGLGLAVVYGIIKSHDGVICVESEPGQGSTFRVYIPTIIAAREEKNKHIEEAIPGGNERIMFVDDETALTTIFKIQFESLGYSVDVFNDPVEALAAFQKEPQSFALVTTDMSMPHMMGIDLAREMTKIRPDLPVILCTGAVDELDQEILHSLGIRRLILKPIFTKDLACALRQVLDGEDQS